MKTYKENCKKYKEMAETLKQKLKAMESSVRPVVTVGSQNPTASNKVRPDGFIHSPPIVD